MPYNRVQLVTNTAAGAAVAWQKHRVQHRALCSVVLSLWHSLAPWCPVTASLVPDPVQGVEHGHVGGQRLLCDHVTNQDHKVVVWQAVGALAQLSQLQQQPGGSVTTARLLHDLGLARPSKRCSTTYTRCEMTLKLLRGESHRMHIRCK